MITQAESGLTTAQYAALTDAKFDSLYQISGFQWDLDFSTLTWASGSVTGSDAAIFDDTIYRLRGTVLERYVSSTWSSVPGFTTPTGYASDIPGALTVDTDLYVFMVSGSGTSQSVYRNSYDGSNWAGWSQFSAMVYDIQAITACRASRCHVIAVASDNRYELIALESSTAIVQNLFWPFPVESVSSAALGSDDVLLMTSMLPGMVQTRVVNTTVVKKIVPSGGLIAFICRNGSYSDHIEVDVVDQWQPYRYRRHVRASVSDGTLQVLCYCSDGTRQAQITGYRLYTSRDGVNWSHGELLSLTGAQTTGGKLLISSDNYAYFIQDNYSYRAPSTLMVGSAHSSTVLALNDYVLKLSVSFNGMAQLGAELDNHANPFVGTILDGNHTVALVLKDGYYTAEGVTLVQTGIFEVDSYELERGVIEGKYVDSLKLTARDRLAWMAGKTQSEQFVYRDPQAVGADNYADDTTSGYGGLGHSATWEGSWRTNNNELILWSNNAEGQIASTHKIDLWNFDVQVSFNLSQVANNEFAGFLFRAVDHKNQWRCYFDQNTDKIKIDQRIDDADTNKALSASTLGWAASPTTTRHLRLRAYYGMAYVYTSADGITWGEPHLTCVLPGQAAMPTEGSTYPTYVQQGGYVGLIGQGYNPDEQWNLLFTLNIQYLWLWEYNLVAPEIVPPETGGGSPLTTVYALSSHYNTGPVVWTVSSNLTETHRQIAGVDKRSPTTYAYGLVKSDPSLAGRAYCLAAYGLYVCQDVTDENEEFTQVASDVDILGQDLVDYLGGPDYQWGALLLDADDPDWMLVILCGVASVSFDGGGTWTRSRINPNMIDFSLTLCGDNSYGSVPLTFSMEADFECHTRVAYVNSNRLLVGMVVTLSGSGLSVPAGKHKDILFSIDRGLSWSLLHEVDEFTIVDSEIIGWELFAPDRKIGTGYLNTNAQEVWLVGNHYVGDQYTVSLYKSSDGGESFTLQGSFDDAGASETDNDSAQIWGNSQSLARRYGYDLLFGAFNIQDAAVDPSMVSFDSEATVVRRQIVPWGNYFGAQPNLETYSLDRRLWLWSSPTTGTDTNKRRFRVSFDEAAHSVGLAVTPGTDYAHSACFVEDPNAG